MAKSAKKKTRFEGPEKPIPPELKDRVDPARLPRHVAVIMDGNGRWAQKRRLPRIAGHKAGVKTVRDVVEAARELEIRYMTLYAFSSENWKRPKKEVNALMRLLRAYIRDELDEFIHYGIGVKVMGRLDMLPPRLKEEVEQAVKKTEQGDKMTLVVAFSYGGRTEIVDAVKKIATEYRRGRIKLSDINEDLISRNLYVPECPEPDLLIRTSGESRLSNFMLWQVSYSEISFVPTLWPDFTKEEFCRVLIDYQERDRRFGGITS